MSDSSDLDELPVDALSGTVQIPKSFHMRERDRAYDDWTLSIFREYVQNSIDSGATRIDISIASAVPKGFDGRPPDARSVTRLVFEDDGGGMSLDVLNKVYFRLGETTKTGDDSVGGFGRARIMQNFSQVRYSVRTQDLLVEGDGSDYRGFRMKQAHRVMEDWASRTRERAAGMPPGEERDFVEAAAEARQRDAIEMRGDDRFLKGCRFEVDLDPSTGKNSWSKPTVEHMRRQLEQYLSQSDLRCRVFIDGVERVRPAKKREARKDIFATLDPQEVLDAWKDDPRIKILDRPDGRKDVAFGKILVSEDAGNDLIVRVSGASMFKRTLWDSPKNLVIELVPALAREVMTSNRDSLKEPYQRAVDHFQKLMSTDARAALEKRDEKQFTVLSGGKGRRVARRAEMDFSVDFAASALSSPGATEAGAGGTAAPAPQVQKRTYVRYNKYDFDEFLKVGIGGVPHADFAAFFDALRKSTVLDDTFLGRWEDPLQARNFVTTLQRNGESAALEAAGGEMLAFLCNELRERRAKADFDESRRHADKLSDLHDIPILKENLRPDAERLGEKVARERRTKLLSAIGRADPRGWDPASGKGMRPRKILAMWQVAIDACVDLLMETQPRQKPFPYAAGFYFAHPKWQHQPHTGENGWSNALAIFTRPDDSDETRYFLLNPLKDEDFSLAFNPSQAADRSDMVSRAMHEVAHVVAPDAHNERFAGALTFMLGKMTPGWIREVNRSMDAAISAVDAVYAGARTRVQPLDDEPGPRPGDVLMEALPREAAQVLAILAPDGTRELDCDRIDMLESVFVGRDPAEAFAQPDEPVAPRPGM